MLGVERVGIHDNFFALGGHSLTAVKLMSAVRSELGIHLSLSTLFQRPTVAQLATDIESKPRASTEVADHQPHREVFPLSLEQEVFFYHPGLPYRNRWVALELEGPLDVHALSTACAELSRRHEMLRSRLEYIKGRSMQRIAPYEPAQALQLIELSAGARLEDEAQAIYFRDRELNPGSAFTRLQLLSHADRHVFVWTMSHAIADGVTHDLLDDELSSLYSAVAEGRPLPRQKTRLQHSDWVRIQRVRYSDDDLRTSNVAFRKSLAGYQPPFHSGGIIPSQTITTEEMKLTLSPPQERALERFGASHDANFFVTLLSAYFLAIHRTSGQQRLCVWNAFDNRTDEEFIDVPGCHAVILPLLCDLSGTPGPAEATSRMRAAYREHHARWPYSWELLNRDEPGFCSEIFWRAGYVNAWLQEPEAEAQHSRLGSIVARPLPYPDDPYPGQGLDFVVAREVGGALTATLTYCRELIDRPTFLRLVDNLHAVLDEMASTRRARR